ncbi:RNA-directed DNA polymerase [Nitratireductor aquimarinus]|uniref:RNA-directed DNA polymerase n=1 Tax=Nitratireductor aquimarinus TaxID=889300 RepID=UPI00398F0279
MVSSVLQSLLSRGYFPKELPPAFTTKDFGDHAMSILSDWQTGDVFRIKPAKKFGKINGKRHRDRYSYEAIPNADPELISKPKRLYERRNLHITHPIPQALLSKEIAENWTTVLRWLSRRKYSIDEIVVSANFERAIKGINFRAHEAKKSYIEATADWLVCTDISRFYPTIYTHSIPWAAYGKERVKSALKTYEGSFADRLDQLVRSCNRNQTVGIPIGPETSRIIAEIISSRIDEDFATRCSEPHQSMIDRLQDDWTVGSSTLEGAEKILSAISACYREYGLEINGSKTSINHILASRSESWKSEISAFLSHRNGGLQGGRMKEFLSLCLRLQLENPAAPALNYALAVIEGRKYSRSDIEMIESFLLKSAAIAPSSLDRVCRILLNIDYRPGGLSKDRIVDRFTKLAERHFENGALFEVIWLLYTLRGFKKPFRSKKLMELACATPSSAIRLILLDTSDKGYCTTPAPVSAWEDEIEEDGVLANWSWLFAYEGIRHGWLSDKKGLMAKPFFKAMADRDVVFYDPRRNVRKSQSVKRDRQRESRDQEKEVLRLLEQLRGVEFSVSLFSSEY